MTKTTITVKHTHLNEDTIDNYINNGTSSPPFDTKGKWKSETTRNKGQGDERHSHRRKETKISCNERETEEGFKRMVHDNDTNLSNKKSFTLLDTQSTK